MSQGSGSGRQDRARRYGSSVRRTIHTQGSGHARRRSWPQGRRYRRARCHRPVHGAVRPEGPRACRSGSRKSVRGGPRRGRRGFRPTYFRAWFIGADLPRTDRLQPDRQAPRAIRAPLRSSNGALCSSAIDRRDSAAAPAKDTSVPGGRGRVTDTECPHPPPEVGPSRCGGTAQDRAEVADRSPPSRGCGLVEGRGAVGRALVDARGVLQGLPPAGLAGVEATVDRDDVADRQRPVPAEPIVDRARVRRAEGGILVHFTDLR